MSLFSNIIAKIQLGQCTYDKSRKGTQPTFYTSVISALTLALASLLFLTLVLFVLFLIGKVAGLIGIVVSLAFAAIFGVSLILMRTE